MWFLICIFFDAWLAISANAKAMDRWPTVPLSLARTLFCWSFIYCADVRSSSLTKYGWKPSVTESEVENQGLRNDRCAKAQLKNVTRWKTRDAEQSLIQSLSLSLSICRDSGSGAGGRFSWGAVLPTVRGERSDFCDKATPCLVQVCYYWRLLLWLMPFLHNCSLLTNPTA